MISDPDAQMLHGTNGIFIYMNGLNFPGKL